MTYEDEQTAARKLPTIGANRFLVENEGSTTVRLSFGEAWNGETVFHQSCRLSFEDALQLHTVLGSVLSAKSKADS